MDEPNESSPQVPNRTFRVRRPSSSLISSTTSPLVLHQPQPLPLSAFQGPSTSSNSNRASASLSSRLANNSNNNVSNIHDTDEDVQPSSSTSSFNTFTRRALTQRSSSPLGSPDTTYHWSPSPAGGGGSFVGGLQDPPTPGGMCVSSTTDDCPPSPYSPEPPPMPSNNNNNHRSLSQFRNNISIPSSPVMLPPAPPQSNNNNHARSSSSLGSILLSESLSSRNSSSAEPLDSHPILPPVPISSQSSSSSASSNFCSSIALNSMSPLKNKIKKASSFERFSAQAQASRTHEIGDLSHIPTVNCISEGNNNSSLPGPSRLMWEYQQQSSSTSTTSAAVPKFVSSINETAASLVLSTTKQPFHIKKLAAKLANVIEQSSKQQQHQNQTVEPNEANSVAVSEPLIRRQLSQSPLNLTDSGAAGAAVDQHVISRNVPNPTTTTSTKSFLTNKNIPMTPKQKLLQRMQSGEIIIPSSNSPPPPQQPQISISLPSPPPPIQEPTQLVLNSYQQQTQVSQHLMIPEPLEMDENGPPSPNMCGIPHYESFIRSNNEDDLLVGGQDDDMSKSVDPSVSQILYDPGDAYPYGYYGNMQVLPEDFFSSNVNVPTIRNNSSHYSIIGPEESMAMSLSHGMNGQHSNNQHLEFVMGLSARDCDGQLEDSQEELHHQQFLDPNEINLSKSQAGQQCSNGNDSTLRNLLMMDSLARSNNDDSWISVPTQEYHNRFGGGSSSLRSNASQMSGLNNNSWVNEWPRNSWQGQEPDDHENDQDEVMDMSVMDIEKSRNLIGNHHHSQQSQHQQQFSSSGSGSCSLDDGDLPIPIIFNNGGSMPLPLDLQQHYAVSHNNKSNNSLGLPSNSSSGYKMDLQQQQQQHRNVMNMNYEDEPVNLMSATLVEQALTTHRQLHKSNSPESDIDIGPVESVDSSPYENSNCISEPSNILFTTTSTTSTTVTAAGFEGVLQLPDTIEERRIIRVPKKYESQSIMINLLEQAQGEHARPIKQTNLVLDKPVQPKSHASIPSILSLEPSESELNKFKVVATERILPDTRFGPVEGPVTTLTREDLNLVLSTKDYPAFLMVDNLNTLLQVDKSDDKYCNWMKHTRLAQTSLEQNAFIYEEKGLLYFTTCKDIPPKTELKVGYGSDYAYKYKLSCLEFDPTVVETGEPLQHQHQQQQENLVEEPSQNHLFSCSECDLNFSSEDELGKHIYSDHNDGDGFRKPKKKAIKVYNSLKQSLAAGIEKEKNNSVKRQAAESSSIIPPKKQKAKKVAVVEQIEKVIPQIKEQEESSPIVGSSSGETWEKPTPRGVVLPANGNKVKCGTCYKIFANKERLEKHFIVHSKEFQKPIECKYCSKRFLTNSALAGHAKSHKEVGNNFECPLCSFVTQGLSKLKDHVPVHKDEMGEFTCPYCPLNKKFPAYPLIRKHIRAFHGPRLFGCSSCDKRFPNADKLKLHELKHSNFKAYLCAECGKQFKRKDKLADHMRKSHAPGKQQPIYSPPPPTTPTTSPQSKFDDKKFTPRLTAEELIKYTFRCHDCMRGFRRRGMLVNHLAKRHPEKNSSDIPELNMPITRPAKNFECLYCDKIYKSSSKRKCHIQKNHPGKSVPPPSRGKDLTSLLQASSNVSPAAAQVLIKKMNLKTGGLEALKKTVNQVIRKETIVGKILGVPHPCEWCYRQYATRAKLLQHQRKQHYELMPKDMQMPRTQKNNVMKSGSEDSILLLTHEGTATTTKKSGKLKKSRKLLQIPNPNRTTTTIETVSTSTSTSPPQPSFTEENVIGYLVTTSGGGSDLRLLPQELVMGIIPPNSSSSTNQLIETSSSSSGTTKTITVCIPHGTNLSDANAYITHMISNGISVTNGNQILTSPKAAATTTSD